MKKFFFILSIFFAILFFVNIGWISVNIYMWLTFGFESIIKGENLIEDIYYSDYIKWILLSDAIWIISALIFVYNRKQFKTDVGHFLQRDDVINPKICVTMPTFNEEKGIESVVKNFITQKFVEKVIVVDNHSSDNTVKLAETNGAEVITKEKNRGFSHSYILGLKESLKTDANVIVVTESDGTFDGKDIEKLLPYLDNCDVVTGSRSHQILTEKDNQNGRLHVYGNIFLAKLIQLKYFSLNHLGTVNLTDVGCGLMIMKRSAVEKMIERFSKINTDRSIWNMSARFYTILLAIEQDLRIIEIPVTFKKRIGESKYSGQSVSKSLKIGFNFLWLIFRY
tara:strand:+ start:7382 stop:8395 length:1014 start_codon:yes stop_codon:yes gene_type:complete